MCVCYRYWFVFFVLAQCSSDNYLHFDGAPQTPTEIQSGIVDTHNCDLGFKFEGNAESVIKYDQINLAGHDQFTVTIWEQRGKSISC